MYMINIANRLVSKFFAAQHKHVSVFFSQYQTAVSILIDFPQSPTIGSHLSSPPTLTVCGDGSTGAVVLRRESYTSSFQNGSACPQARN
jgi:hypothetical protein